MYKREMMKWKKNERKRKKGRKISRWGKGKERRKMCKHAKYVHLKGAVEKHY